MSHCLKYEGTPSMTLASAGITPSRLIDVIDNIDREGDAYTEATYARSGAYAHGLENKPGKRIPRAGVFAKAGVWVAKAECSVFEAEAKGPNASAGAEVAATGVAAIARAEIGSVSACAGPVKVSLGLGVDTGISAGVDGLEMKFLGTGFTLGPTPSVSLFSSKVECVVM